MKIKLFGKTFFIGYKEENKKPNEAIKRLQINTQNKIKKALFYMIYENIDYSEYKLQKISKVSINTIKKYRKEIETYKEGIKNSIMWQKRKEEYEQKQQDELKDIDWSQVMRKKSSKINNQSEENKNRIEANKQKAQDNKQKIIDLLKENASLYKKSNSTWNKTKIAKELNLDRNTVASHLKNIKF